MRALKISTYKSLPFAIASTPVPSPDPVKSLFSPTPVTFVDVKTDLGRTRCYWVREELKNEKPPLVLLHGWVAGTGCFYKNVADMASDRAILMIDLPGFAQSERPEFPEEPEDEWVKSLKDVIAVEVPGETTFWIGGHSFGGYLAARLAIEADFSTEGVILLDAWGIKESEMTFEERVEKRLNWWQKILLKSYQGLGLNFGGMDILRALPMSLGPKILKAARKDLAATYGNEFLDYIFEINSAKPASGEIAFSNLNAGFGYAKNPMGPRMLEKHENLPKNIHFLYGGKSWVENSVGYKIIKELEAADPNFKCSVTVVENASHHLQCTHPEEVNSVVNKILNAKI